MSGIKLPTMTPRLRERLDFFKVEPPPWMPLHDRVFVVLLGDKTEEEGRTVTGPDGQPVKLHFADQTKGTMAAQKGLVVAAGAAGWEQLYSMGVSIGDIVVCNRLSRWEKAYSVNGKPYSVLICRAGEITAGVDLHDRFEKGEVWYEMNRETNQVEVCDREETRQRNDPAFADDTTV